MKTGGSAIPTPVGNTTQVVQPKKEDAVDPLAMWRAAEQQQKPANNSPPASSIQNIGTAQPDNSAQVQQNNQEIQQMAQAMQTQITSLTQAWAPMQQATVVAFTNKSSSTSTDSGSNGSSGGSGSNGSGGNGTGSGQSAQNNSATTPPAQKTAKVVVPAGDIYYGTMITEANSDVPGPILAQVVSGPLNGGRLVGSFQSTDEYLVLKFTTLSIGGRTYSIDAIALDPHTTLGGVATETDQRYFARLVLPMAAAFISQFGQAISQPDSTTSVSNGTVATSTSSSTDKQALYAGLGQSAQQLSSFVNQSGNAVKPLVRVASNTPVGIFFIKPVTDQPQQGQ